MRTSAKCLSLLPLLLVLILCAPAFATTGYVASSACVAATTSCTLGVTPQRGDILIAGAYRSNSATAPTIATGYTQIQSQTANVNALKVGYKYSDGTETTCGTWTAATQIMCAVYRGMTVGSTGPLGVSAKGGVTATPLSYPTPGTLRDANSWVVGIGGGISATNLDAAPAGSCGTPVLRSGTSITNIGLWDTNAGVSSCAAQSQAYAGGGAASAVTFELKPTENYAPIDLSDYLVQYKAGTHASSATAGDLTGSTTFTLTFPEANLSGNFLGLVFAYNNFATLTTVSSVTSTNNTWTLGGCFTDATNVTKICLYYVPNATAGDTKVTVTLSAAVMDLVYDYVQLRQIATSTPIEAMPASNGAAVAAPYVSAGAITTVTSNDLILHSCMNDANGFYWPGAGATGIFIDPSATFVQADINGPIATEIFKDTTTGAITPTMAFPGDTSTAICIGAAIKTSAGTGNALSASGIHIVGEDYKQSNAVTTAQTIIVPQFGTSTVYAQNNQQSANQFNGTPTDSNGNTYAVHQSLGNPAFVVGCNTPANNTRTFKYTLVNAQGSAMVRYDLQGADNSSATACYDATASYQTATGSQGAVTTITGPSITPTNAGAMAFWANMNGTGPDIGINAPTGSLFDCDQFNGGGFTDAETFCWGNAYAHTPSAGSSSTSATWQMAAVNTNSYNNSAIAILPSSSSVSNSANISDTSTSSPAVAAVAGHTAAISETSASAPAVTATAAHAAAISETLTTTPSIAPLATHSDALSESFTTSPAVTAFASRFGNISESITAVPALSTIANKFASETESLTTTPALFMGRVRGLSESITTSPTITALSQHIASLSASFSTAPAVATGSQPQATISDSITTASNVTSITGATDFFNRSNGPLGSNWQFINFSGDPNSQSGFLQISGNQVQGTDAGYNIAVRTDIWSADQTSQVKLVNIGSFAGAVVRGSQQGYYVFFTDGTATGNWMRKVIPGISSVTATDIAANINLGSAWTAGDILKVGIVGSTLSIYRNGALLQTYTDTQLTSGAPGMMTFGTTEQMDDWAGTTTGSILAAPSIGWVNSTHLENATALTSQTTPSFNTTGSSAIVLFVSSHPLWPAVTGSSITVSSISDNEGNTYSLLDGPKDFSGTSGDLRSWMYYAASPTTGTGHTITVTFSAAAPVILHAVAVSGTDLNAPIMKYSGFTGSTSTTSCNSSSLSVVGNSSLLLGFAKPDTGAGTWNGNLGGFIQDGNFSQFGAAQFLYPTTSGSYNAGFSTSNTVSCQTALVAVGTGSNALPSSSITSTPTITVVSGRNVVLADTSTSAPAVAVLAGHSAALAGAITTASVLVAQPGRGALMSDSSTSATAVVTQAAHQAAIPNTLTISPAVTASKNGAPSANLNDSVTTSPAIQGTAQLAWGGSSESITTSSAILAPVGRTDGLSSSLTSSPAVVVILGRNAVLGVPATTSPAVSASVNGGSTNNSANISDTLTTAVNIAALAAHSASVSESFTTSPSVLIIAAHGASLSDSENTAISIAALAGHIAGISESVTSSPGVGALAGRNGVLADSFNSSPAVAGTKGRGATLADGLTVGTQVVANQALNAVLNESFSTATVVSIQGVGFKSINDSFTASPGISVLANKGTALQDSVTAAIIANAKQDLFRSTAVSVTSGAQISIQLAVGRTIADSFTTSIGITAIPSRAGFSFESVTVSPALLSSSTHARILVDAVVTSDSIGIRLRPGHHRIVSISSD